MPFQLKITFAGMCLLVRDQQQPLLHVLLPPVRTGGPHPHEPHVARLIYDPAHRNPGGAPTQNVSVSRADDVPLENTAIDLSGLAAASGFDPGMPAEVVDLAQATPKPVSRALFQGGTGGRAVTRITLANGAVSNTPGGDRWSLGQNPPQHMATAVEWTIDGVQGDSLRLGLEAMDGSSQNRTLELFPTSDGVLNLYVFHSPDDDLPESLPPTFHTGPVPGQTPVATHFRFYYDLIDNLPVKPPVPVYQGNPPPKAGGVVGIKGLKITCITATASG